MEILEANACLDHIHMLVSIPPTLSVSNFLGYLKVNFSLMIFDKHAKLKYRYGNRQFLCKGYYVDTVGRNKKSNRRIYKESVIRRYSKLSNLKYLFFIKCLIKLFMALLPAQPSAELNNGIYLPDPLLYPLLF